MTKFFAKIFLRIFYSIRSRVKFTLFGQAVCPKCGGGNIHVTDMRQCGKRVFVCACTKASCNCAWKIAC